MRLLFLIIGLAQVFLGFSSAATLSSNGSSADVQSKIDGAQAGDVIAIPAGTFSGWNVSLSKGVTLQGAGEGKSTIKGNGTNVVLNVSSSSGTTRLTGLTFDGGTAQSVMIRYSGGGAGLVDHCSFSGGSASEMIHNEAYGPNTSNKAKGWSNDVTPGSADALYVEDCTFSKNPLQDQYFWGTSAMQGYYGSRTVMRHNTFNYCQVDQHGTQGNIGARWFEIYDNTFTIPSSGGNQSDFIVLRGGSGVVYNNTVTGGKNDGGGNLNIYDENGGSSPAYTGRGWNQNPSPIYLWAVDPKMHVTAGSSNVQSGRDFFNSAAKPSTQKIWQTSAQNANSTYTFMPLAYPHPMAGGGPTPTPTATPSATPSPTPLPPSTKFKNGDSIKASPNQAYVRSSAGGDLLGNQPVDTVGTVMDGPVWGSVPDTGQGVYWWAIDFPSGVDGWVGEDNLVKVSAVPTPTPAPTATPAPTVTPKPPAQTFEKWLEEQNNWVRAHPPYPDQ